jgi:hypothetical protein
MKAISNRQSGQYPTSTFPVLRAGGVTSPIPLCLHPVVSGKFSTLAIAINYAFFPRFGGLLFFSGGLTLSTSAINSLNGRGMCGIGFEFVVLVETPCSILFGIRKTPVGPIA